jgi:hypothetical protein
MQITDVTQAAFDKLHAQLSTQAEVTGTTDGTITGHGVTANYQYDSTGQTLSVEVIHHPFYISESMIESQLRQALA